MKRDLILEDTRNKIDKNEYIRTQLEDLGYEVDRQALYVGDYTFANNHSVCIDTKQNLSEVCSNVTQDHQRFKNECIRAQKAGIKLIILICDPDIKDLSGVFSWRNPARFFRKRATTGKTLGKILYKMRDTYGVQFEFSKEEDMGKRIVELLEGE